MTKICADPNCGQPFEVPEKGAAKRRMYCRNSCQKRVNGRKRQRAMNSISVSGHSYRVLYAAAQREGLSVSAFTENLIQKAITR